MAGSLSLFFDCIRSDVGNVTSIPTDDGVLGEPSGKGSGPGEGDAKNGLSIPTGGSLVVESIDS